MIEVKVKLGQPYIESILTIDGEDLTVPLVAARCGISVGYLKNNLRRPDLSYEIQSWMDKKKAGVRSSLKTYYYKDCPAWVSEVKNLTGCSPSSAGKRLLQWVETGDCDRLYRPVEDHTGNKTSSELSKTIKKSNRKLVSDLKPVGSWEAKNL